MSAAEVRVVAGEGELAPWLDQWDALAVARGRPFCSPAWMLAWWRHVAAPRGAQLRVGLALDAGGRLAAVAPLAAQRSWTGLVRWRVLASGTSAPVEPLAAPGREHAATAALAAALAHGPAGIVWLEGVPAETGWGERIAGALGPRRGRVEHEPPVTAPLLSLEAGSLEAWLATKRSKSRRRLERGRRELEAIGARFRLSSRDALERDLDAFARLHHSRWRDRGGSRALTPAVEAMLRDAARALPEGRLRLWNVDLDGEVVASELIVAAGGVAASWLGGFDERIAEHGPSLQTLLAAIGDSFERGERVFEHGPGVHEFKLRLANGESRLEHAIVVPGSRRVAVRARLAAQRAPQALARQLPERAKRALRPLARRPR